MNVYESLCVYILENNKSLICQDKKGKQVMLFITIITNKYSYITL